MAIFWPGNFWGIGSSMRAISVPMISSFSPTPLNMITWAPVSLARYIAWVICSSRSMLMIPSSTNSRLVSLRRQCTLRMTGSMSAVIAAICGQV
jgi:hypothetical protein